MFRRWIALVPIVLAVLLFVRGARADQSTAHGVPVAVLAIDSDDAEEQAEALTGALRSRVRTSQGWVLVETNQSLGMLTAALRCPTKPMSAECEQRIGEHLKADRYIFGWVTKGPQAGQVTAEVHLYQKNKPDTVQRETFSDNLRDQNDESLRKVAQHVIDAFGGAAVGTVVVRMGSENGEIVIDGDKRVPMQNGLARVDLSPGSHSVEVALVGQAPQKRNVLVTAGKETTVSLGIGAGVTAPPPEPERPFPVKKVIGGGLAIAGLVAGTIAVLNFVAYNDANDRGDKIQASTNPQDAKLPAGKSADEACGSALDAREAICVANDDANRASTVAWATGGASVLLLGAGAYFLFFDKDKPAPTTAKPRLVPTVGHGGGGLILSGSF